MNTTQPTKLSFLSDLERDTLQAFVQNEVMKEALKKVILDGILNMGIQKEGEKTGLLRNWVFGIDPQGVMSDEDFGRMVKVRTEAMILLEQAYTKLNELAQPVETPKVKNKAL